MKGRRFGITALCAAAGIFVAIKTGYHAGLRLNFTDSAPHGLWIVQTANAASIKRGDMIEVCPPDSPIVRLMGEEGYLAPGDCEESGLIPLLKPVAAVEGDDIHFEIGGLVTVNGVSMPNTAAMPALPGWPAGRYIVQPGEVWLFSSYSAGSFDSRYFGPVVLERVRGIARPVAVRESSIGRF